MDPRDAANQLLAKHVGGGTADLNHWVGLLAEAGVAESTLRAAFKAAAGNEAAFGKDLERKGVIPALIVSTHRAAGGSGITVESLLAVSTGGLGFGWLPHGSPTWQNFYGKF